MPFGASVAFQLANVDRDKIVTATSWAAASKATNLAGALRQHWSQVSKTVATSECPPVETPEEPGNCLAAGTCLCTDEGKRLFKFRNSVLRNMKNNFPAKSDVRQQLYDGDVILRLDTKPMDDDYEAIANMDDPFQEFYLHIGLMSLNPYKPTFHLLKRVAPLAEMPYHPGRLYLQALCLCVCATTHRHTINSSHPSRSGSKIWD